VQQGKYYDLQFMK